MKGMLVIVSSPSGGGKTSIIQKLLKKYPGKYVYSISATTRKPRPGEVDGKDYFFLTEDQFKQDIDRNRFLEWEQVHGYFYGTPKAHIEKCIDEGKYVFLDIDVNGALRVAENYPDRAITVFIAPPSIDELIERLKNRKTDSKEEIDRRLVRIPMEMEKSKQFRYVVVNDKLDKTVRDVDNIVRKFNS